MHRKLPKILITGGAGFIGSEFIRQLVPGGRFSGHQVVVVDKLTYAADLSRLAEVKNKFKFYKIDVCDYKRLKKIFEKEKPEYVVNFSAETHVDKSIINSNPFIETNIKGTKNLLDLVIKFKIPKIIHISCYDEKTRALTTEGFKSYKELKKGDLVFSLNPLTQKIEAKPVEKVIIQHYRGKMIYFKNKRIDLMVTPNHNMFILNTKKKFIIETAQESAMRSIFYMPDSRWGGKEEDSFEVEGYGKVNTSDLMYILGIFIGDGFTAYQEKESPARSGLNRGEYLKLAKDTITGRFKKMEKLGNHKTVMHSYRIFFDIPEGDRCRKKVEQSLKILKIKYSIHKGKSGTHLYFTSKPFMELFNQCGQGAYNKQIPRWALEYSPRYLRFLFDGLMDSDGSRGHIYHTVSNKLVAGFCELCFKIGIKPHIGKRHSKSFLNNRRIEGDSNYITVSNTMKSISRHRNRGVNYNGDIWCLKVADNKNFIVERNGKLDFCGNTDEVYGDIKQGAFFENSPIRANSPYAVSKAAADLLIGAYIRTYKLSAVIVRPSNNYGPWQYPEKFIPVIIYKAIKNEKIPVYGKGENVREWLYVGDCANAILKIVEKGKIGEIYNLGSGNERKNIDLVKEILSILGKPLNLISYVQDRPGHDFRYSLDSSKIRKDLGWKPQVAFENGLIETVDWYRKNLAWLEKKAGYLRNYWKKVYKLK